MPPTKDSKEEAKVITKKIGDSLVKDTRVMKKVEKYKRQAADRKQAQLKSLDTYRDEERDMNQVHDASTFGTTGAERRKEYWWYCFLCFLYFCYLLAVAWTVIMLNIANEVLKRDKDKQ